MPQPQRLLANGDGFYLALRGDIGLDTANRLLNEKLANKPFDAGGKQVLINSLQLYGSGDKAVLGLQMHMPEMPCESAVQKIMLENQILTS